MAEESTIATFNCANERSCINRVIVEGYFCDECRARHLHIELEDRIDLLASFGYEIPGEAEKKIEEAARHIREGEYRRAIGACWRAKNLLAKPEVEESMLDIDSSILSPTASLLYADLIESCEAGKYLSCKELLEKLALVSLADQYILETEAHALTPLDNLYLVDARKEYDQGNFQVVIDRLVSWSFNRESLPIAQKAERKPRKKGGREIDRHWQKRLGITS